MVKYDRDNEKITEKFLEKSNKRILDKVIWWWNKDIQNIIATKTKYLRNGKVLWQNTGVLRKVQKLLKLK